MPARGAAPGQTRRPACEALRARTSPRATPSAPEPPRPARAGVGPKTAERLVQAYGDGVMEVLDGKGAAAALARVPGIGAAQAARIKAAWDANRGARAPSGGPPPAASHPERDNNRVLARRGGALIWMRSASPMQTAVGKDADRSMRRCLGGIADAAW